MLSVNTNSVSLNAQTNLSRSQAILAKSLERLSSGLRINKASDDAAGLSISEGLRSQIRGFEQATRNATDGISLLQTAEGAMGQVTEMVQRMRELSIESSNDTLSSQNRQDLNNEVSQLVSEITRIGSTVTFNGISLVDGTFQNKSLQIGASANQTFSISISDMRASSLGQVAVATGTASTAALAGGDLVINGTDIGATSTDGVSTSGGNYSAIAMANAVNAKTGTTGVTATVLGTSKTSTSAIAGGAITSGQLTINGVNIGAVTVQANDSDSSLRNAINAKTNQTGVVATVDSSNKLVLTASDGRNIDFNATNATVAGYMGMAAGDATAVFTGRIELTSNTGFSLSGTGEAKAGFTDNQTVAIDSNTAINKIDITTISGSQSAISRLDAALKQINSRRSQIGAYQNRLEATISHLEITKQNLSSADSRIRDADFAVETANLTKSQIIQQAGMAMLAQANSLPQMALSLLRS